MFVMGCLGVLSESCGLVSALNEMLKVARVPDVFITAHFNAMQTFTVNASLP